MPIDEKKLKKSLEDNGKKIKFSSKELESVAKKRNRGNDGDVIEICKENNLLLKKLVKHQRWETFFSFLKILIIIIPLVAAYIFLTPMLSQVIESYQSALGTVNELQTTTDSLKELEDIDIGGRLKEMGELFK